jgi:hypothetical protein
MDQDKRREGVGLEGEVINQIIYTWTIRIYILLIPVIYNVSTASEPGCVSKTFIQNRLL